MVTATTAAAHYLLVGLQSVGIRRGCNQGHNLTLCRLLHNLMAERSAHKNQPYDNNMYEPRAHQPVRPVIVVLTPDFLGRERFLETRGTTRRELAP